jgi:hypothetical protein
MNHTSRQIANNFLLSTQVLIGSGGILVPIAIVELLGLVEVLMKHLSKRTPKDQRLQADVIELRFFLFLQLITSLALMAEMAIPVFTQPLIGGVSCTGIAISVW